MTDLRQAQHSVLTMDEAAVFAQFSGGEILGPDALGERTGLAPNGLAAALMMLELKRAVVKRADGTYEQAVG